MGIRFGNVEIFRHDMKFDFMKYRTIWIGFSALMVLIALAAIAVKGVNYSIDFLGGAEVTMSFTDKDISREKIEEVATKAAVGKVEVSTVGAVGGLGESYLLRIQREKGTDETATSTRAEKLVKTFQSDLGADKVKVGSVTNISGKIGDEEQKRGYMAILLSFVMILIYVGIRFDARFAPGAVICLLHDVVIALGVMTLLDKPFSVASIAAFLTIVGYSCNDTIIVYDRIREIQALNPRAPLLDVVNQSINQTMNRTVITSAMGLIALLILVFLGGGAIEDFALTMFIGILVGTYSSIYVAAPLTLVMDNFIIARGWASADRTKKAKVEKDPNYIPPVVLKRKPEGK